ncbi:sialate O-acetylesterase [Haloferula sp.]|uniref:sialate O-acetylesterase n=1 Tax=Haloferula sp. TaxID=2497595 RepID=UPI003C77B7F6
MKMIHRSDTVRSIRRRALVATTTAAISLLFAAGLQARTWTSADGERTFEGDLVAYDVASGKVTVGMANGSELVFDQSKLSEVDLAFLKENGSKSKAAGGSGNAAAKPLPAELPDPDGKEADMSKPVQVFILMGQSNMLGFGKVAGGLDVAAKAGDYPFLVDDEGEWTTRKDVRNVRVMNFKDFKNDWLTAANTGKIGPELGIGYILGEVLDAPVMILKSCIGNRSLGWDLLPPGSESYEHNGKLQPGYGETPATAGSGEKYQGDEWYAGKQYDDDVASAKKVLEDLDKYYPGAKEYEIAGFAFWQGDKDRYSEAHAERYEQNLVQLIKALRKEFDAPNAKFVCATLGQTKKGADGNDGMILEGTLAVDGKSGKYPEFKGNVASVYTHPLSEGGASNGHYGGNAKTYMNVGIAMGEAMAELLGSSSK